MAEHILGEGCVLIERPAQDRAAFQIRKFVNTESSVAVAGKVALPAADDERVSRRVRWIELERTDRQRNRAIH